MGCGYGWHSIYAIENGASSVVAIDISKKMLDIAKEKNASPQINYIQMAIEDINFEEESFDIVLSSLAFHYVEDQDSLIKKVYKLLKPEGKLVFTVEHPVFTSHGSQEWHYYEKGMILHFPVDNYYYQGKRLANFLGEQVIKYHRTLTTYLSGLLYNEFELNHVIEPEPPEEMIHIEGMKDEMRRPMMIIIAASKKDKD